MLEAMTSKIALLSDDAINQIAAGEVVENPASVIKELLDNAIDAGAQNISIEIQAGGHQSIFIEDDGCGMSRDDVQLSLLRHATSKIRKVEDLDQLETMGFRGEALAAIASVSKLEIRTSDGVEATHLVAEGGEIQLLESCARNRGTTIEVRSLFFNAPARRKFQKSTQASSSAVVRIVQSLALSHPEIAFSLRSQQQSLLQVNPSGYQERIEAVFGSDFSQGTWFEEGRLSGMLGSPADARATRTGQQFFLNRRPIFSPLLSRALRDGYGTRLATGSHPSAVIFLEMDPGEFDVNVHPQKREVRFHGESRLFTEVLKRVQSVFVPQQHSEPVEPFAFSEPPLPPFALREEAPPLPAVECQGMLWPQDLGERPLAIVGSYLLLECQGDLFLADLGEAYEQKVMQTNERQSLIFPLEFTLSLEESERVEELVAHLGAAGLDARMVGPKALCIDAIPDWLETEKTELLFTALKEDLFRGIPSDATLRRLRSGCCKRLTLQEAASLWRLKRGVKEKRIELSDLARLFEK